MIERDVETIIDIQLKNLSWIDDPKNNNRNVFKQTAKTKSQKKSLGRTQPDYVLYQSHSNKPLIVIEAKRPNRSVDKALEQGLEYCDKLKAPICYATDGVYVKTNHVKTGKPLFRNGEEVEEFIREIHALKYINNNEIKTLPEKVIASRKELINVFDSANNLLRQEGLQAGIERFSEFSNVLFLKLISELEDIKEESGESPMIDKEFRWNYFKNMRGGGLLSYVNETVLMKFRHQYHDDIFEKLQINTPSVIESLIDKLDPLSLTDINSDIKGDAFEYFLSKYTASNSDLGEYFTPRHIVKTCVKMINPQIGETIYDPFCGTGGMLIESFKHLSNNMARTENNIKTLQQNTIFGNEITKNARITKMNMILMGDGHNNIKRTDSLKNVIDGKYDIVITNMPFSQETSYGDQYDIPTNNGTSICIQHCIKSINKNSETGRLAIIVGDDVLINDSYEPLREYIFKQSKLQSIISLPPGVFSPYSKTVKTNILFLKDINKKTLPKQKDYWFFSVYEDGFSFEENRKKLKDGRNDLEDFIIHRDDHQSTLFTKVELGDIKLDKYKLIPFLGASLELKNSVKLGNICFEKNAFAGENFTQYEVGSVASRKKKEGGLVPKSDYYKKPFQSKDRSKYKIVFPNEFVYRREGLDIGTIGYNRYDYPFIVSPIYVVFAIDTQRVVHEYLYNILRNNNFLQIAKRLKVGLARPKVDFKEFSKLEIPLPSLEKQKQICMFEKAIKDKTKDIENLEERINKEIKTLWAPSSDSGNENELVADKRVFDELIKRACRPVQ